jgi:hypothetical protein
VYEALRKAITWPFGSSAALRSEHVRWRDARPSQVFLQGPLHAHGLARKLGEDHGVGFGAIAAKGGAPVLTGVVEPTNDNLIRGYAQRIRDLRAQAEGAILLPGRTKQTSTTKQETRISL